LASVLVVFSERPATAPASAMNEAGARAISRTRSRAARLDQLRASRYRRAELPGEQVGAHGGDVGPLQAIEDALRMFAADEIVVVTGADEEATWLEAGLGEKA
jgi:hypothetical protein